MAISEIHNTKHCVADTVTQSFICKNCGGALKFPELPMDLLSFSRMGRRFMKKHQNCKSKELANANA